MSSKPAGNIVEQSSCADAPGAEPTRAPGSPKPVRAPLPKDAPLALEIRGLGKCYHIYDTPGDRLRQSCFAWTGRNWKRDFWALRDVSFSVRKGEAFGVVGRNGSGKSTLMSIIAGVLTPSEGEAEIHGRPSALLELGSAFNPEFTGRENVYLYGAILGMSRGAIEQRFDRIAAFADIGRFLDQPVKSYSSGMKLRLAFSVQVQLEPEILVIDEALAVGDNLFQKRCHQRLHELREQGVTLLLVSHQPEVVRTLTDRAILLHEGRMRSIGPSSEILLDYRRLLHEEEKRWHTARTEAYRAKPDPASNGATNSRASTNPPAPATDHAPADQHSYGDRDATIESVEILDEAGLPCGAFRSGEPVTVRVNALMHKRLTNLSVGLRLRNKEGVKIYSWGTLNQDISIWAAQDEGEAPGDPAIDEPVFWDRRFEPGERVRVEFTCDCPLGHGFYEVQAMVAHEKDPYYRDERMLHWIDEAGFFQVTLDMESYFFGGVCDLRMRARATPPGGSNG